MKVGHQLGRGSAPLAAYFRIEFIRVVVRATLVWSVGLIVSFALSACGTTKPPAISADAPGRIVDTYRIGVDDSLQVSVWRNPELSVTVPVRPDGMISVPLVGDVKAGGRTPMEVSDELRKKLSVYVREPNVTVIVTGLKSHEYLNRVRVTGAVRQNRSLAYRQGMTVLDAVLEAGGPNDFASPNGTKLYRTIDGQPHVYDIELRSILEKGDLETNYVLLPGDVVTVPERLF